MVGGNIARSSRRYVRAEKGLKELKKWLMSFQAERGKRLMITRLETIQAGRGQYLYKECEAVQRTKGPKADKGIKSQSML